MEDLLFYNLTFWVFVFVVVVIIFYINKITLQTKNKNLKSLLSSHLSYIKTLEESVKIRDRFITELDLLIVELKEYIGLQKHLNAILKEKEMLITEELSRMKKMMGEINEVAENLKQPIPTESTQGEVRKPTGVMILRATDGKTWDIVEDWGGIIATGFHKAKEAMDYAKNQGWLVERKKK